METSRTVTYTDGYLIIFSVLTMWSGKEGLCVFLGDGPFFR